MNQCRNCGATIHEGDTFCRTCAMPIEEMSFLANNSNNVATSDFMTQSSPRTVTKEPTVVYSKNNSSFSSILKDKIGMQEENKDNKQYVEREGNDRTKATLLNFLGLAVLVIGLLFLLKFVFSVISG